jgi:iron complex transport system permease protein
MSWEWDVLRFVSALLAGGLLCFAGSLVQLTSRNELASPSTLGMDGAAVLMVMIAYALESFSFVSLPLSALAFILGCFFIAVIHFSTQKKDHLASGDFRYVLLLGLGLNLLVGSIFAVMQFMAMAFNREFPEQLWFGRMSTLNSWGVGFLILVISLLLRFVIYYRRHWKALLLGRGWCRGLGVPVEKMAHEALMLAFLCTLWVVTHFGVFSFLGLLFPLVLRQIPRYKGEPWREMTDGAVGAGLVFALLDHACFNLTFHGSEIPVGLPAGVLGAAALVGLLWRRAQKA